MIKIDCSDGTGAVQFKGDTNLVLNELKYLVEYSLKVLGPAALEPIYDGVNASEEVLKSIIEGS